MVVFENYDDLARRLKDLNGEWDNHDARHARRQTSQNGVLRIRAGVRPIPWLGGLKFRLCPWHQRKFLRPECNRASVSHPHTRKIATWCTSQFFTYGGWLRLLSH